MKARCQEVCDQAWTPGQLLWADGCTGARAPLRSSGGWQTNNGYNEVQFSKWAIEARDIRYDYSGPTLDISDSNKTMGHCSSR